MPKKSRWGSVAGVALTALLAAGCSSPSADSSSAAANGDISDMEPVIISVSTVSPEGATLSRALEKYTEYIQEASDDKITFDIYWASSLIPYDEALSSTSTGVVDMAFYSPIFSAESMPKAGWLTNLGLLGAETFPGSTLDLNASILEFVNSNEEIQEEYEANNVKALTPSGPPRAEMFCTEPIETTEDAQGSSHRLSGGELWTTPAEEMGFTTVSLATEEVYEGLQRGVVDCVSAGAGASFFPSMGVPEVAPYYAMLNMSSDMGAGYIINLDVWDSLPAEAQAIFDSASAVYAANITEAYIEDYHEFASTADDTGVVFTDSRELNEAMAEFNNDHRDRDTLIESATGIYDDPEATVDEFLEIVDKWSTYVSSDLGVEDIPLEDRTGDAIQQAYLDAPDIDLDAYEQELEDTVASSEQE